MWRFGKSPYKVVFEREVKIIKLKTFLATLPQTKYLLILVPLSIIFNFLHFNPVLIFSITAIGILGIVVLIGKATEEMALYAGPVWGGLLNATFGNVTELIIALFALKSAMYGLVRASITGSILGNLLLLLGLSMFFGGLKYSEQKFSRISASVSIGMLFLVVVGLVAPSLISLGYQFDPALKIDKINDMLNPVSLGVAIVLLLVYALSLVFSLHTHRFIIMPRSEHEEKPVWSKALAIGVLFVATIFVAWESEIFVHAIEKMLETGAVHMSQMFIGVIIVAVVGNAAEGSVAIFAARENKMELSFQVAMGSTIQVALLVAPVIVIASFIIGKPMTLNFNIFELAAIWGGTLIAAFSLQDGESNWFEGLMFLAVYVIFAIVFWFHP